MAGNSSQPGICGQQVCAVLTTVDGEVAPDPTEEQTTEGVAVTAIDEMLRRNKTAAVNHSSGLGPSPLKHLAVVMCMDCRLDAHVAFRLNPGEVHLDTQRRKESSPTMSSVHSPSRSTHWVPVR